MEHPRTTIRESSLGAGSGAGDGPALRLVQLDNGVVEVAFLPELGGKMISLRRRATGREFLLGIPEPGRVYRRPGASAAFADFDTSGFDECLPTVAACRYPGSEFADAWLPDHGELWSVPWQHQIEGEQLTLTVAGRALPFVLTRRVRLEGASVEIDYELANQSDSAFQFLWSAHPLLRVEEGARVVLPESVRELLVEGSKGERLGRPGELCGWPLATLGNGERVDLSLIQSPAAGHADKLFTPRLETGQCELRFPRSNEGIRFRFDPRQTPYVGLWLCQGGWPRVPGHFTVALEPCSGRPDSLAAASARGECRTLPPLGHARWTLSIDLLAG